MKKNLLVTFGVVISVWLCGFLLFAYKINHVKFDGSHKADAIIVLTGGKNRIPKAFEMLDDGLSDKVFISGVFKDASIENILQKNDLSLPENGKVELGKAARNTIENALETREWIVDNRVKSIYLVTSNYHTPRSLEEFRQLNPDITIYPAPVFSENVARKWWSNLGTFRLIFSEYNKFLLVHLNHFIYKFIGE